jgi:hypothetical protein
MVNAKNGKNIDFDWSYLQSVVLSYESRWYKYSHWGWRLNIEILERFPKKIKGSQGQVEFKHLINLFKVNWLI